MPLTEKAFLSGDLGYAKVRLLVDLAKQLPDAYAEAEAVLVEQVQTVRVDQVPIVLARWRALVDTAGEEERAAHDYDQRSLHISPHLPGRLAHRRQPHRRARRDLPQRHRPPRPRALPRRESRSRRQRRQGHSTAAQRRHDALHELLLQTTAAGDAGNDVNVPAITAVIDVTKLTDAKPAEIVGETEHGTPVSARPRCGGAATPASPGSSPHPPPPPSTSATPPGSPTAPNAAHWPPRDRGCTFPGCDRPPGWTSAHHLIHWIHGGPTSLWNQTLLCTFHHHRVHEGRFNVERLPNGELRFTRPDGTTITVPKRRWNDAA